MAQRPPQRLSGRRSSDEPDIHGLFCHYNSLYFGDQLATCAVSWSSTRMTRHAASCHCDEEGYCEIHLSKFLLGQRPLEDLKNTLLHEMIHAYFWIKHQNNNRRDHGRSFQEMVNQIESASADDPQRPVVGYKITLDHDLEKAAEKQAYKWNSDTCTDMLVNNTEREPSSSDHTKYVKHQHDEQCGNRHRSLDSGTCVKVDELSDDHGKDSKGEQHLLDEKTMPSTSHSEQNQRLHHGLSANKNSETQICNVEVCSEEEEANNHVVSIKKCNSSSMVDGTLVVPTHLNRLATNKLQGTDIATHASDSKTKKGSNHKQLKDTNLKSYWNAVPRESPQVKRKHNGEGKNGSYKKQKKDYAVIIEWLDWFSTEDDEIEDWEPLVNKRTVRRERQKLLDMKGSPMDNGHVLAASSSAPRKERVCEIIDEGRKERVCEIIDEGSSDGNTLS